MNINEDGGDYKWTLSEKKMSREEKCFVPNKDGEWRVRCGASVLAYIESDLVLLS